MRWKLLTLITSLILILTTAVAPMKVAAQSIVIIAFILGVVGIGPKEAVELYVVREVPPGQATLYDHINLNLNFDMVGATSGNGTCRDTVQAPVVMAAGLNILQVTRDGDALFINGKDLDLDDCFDNEDVKRVVLTLGIPGPSPVKDGQNPVAPPDEPRVGLVNHARMLGYSIVNLTTHETVASAVREVVPDGFIQTFPGPLP